VTAIASNLKKPARIGSKERLTDELREEEPEELADRVFFGWKPEVKRYRRVRAWKGGDIV